MGEKFQAAKIKHEEDLEKEKQKINDLHEKLNKKEVDMTQLTIEHSDQIKAIESDKYEMIKKEGKKYKAQIEKLEQEIQNVLLERDEKLREIEIEHRVNEENVEVIKHDEQKINDLHEK